MKEKKKNIQIPKQQIQETQKFSLEGKKWPQEETQTWVNEAKCYYKHVFKNELLKEWLASS